MKQFATGLSKLILDLRSRIYPDGPATKITPEEEALGKLPFGKFRVYLVAHSMGGLVCRAFLQNPSYGNDEARKLVDKVFTYATPHNGIEVGLLGNVPGWLSLYGMNTFNRDEIARVLGLTKAQRDAEGNVDIVTNFDPCRIFNLVGTNPGDYRVAAGLSSFAVGEASDGLVRIKNATTRGREGKTFVQSPQAFVNRSHSGYYGIVNSEEGYQNLTRFLFGDVRADGYLDIDELTLPPAVQREYEAGKDVRASYLFEVVVSVRGKPWQLHRRTANENSAIFCMFDELFPKRNAKKVWVPDRNASPMLFNVFLDMGQSQTGKTLAFAVDLCVRVPEYEVAGVLFFKNHFEGGYLFRDMVTLEATPSADAKGNWKVEYQFASQRDQAPKLAEFTRKEGGPMLFEIPIEQPTPPGIKARLRVEARFWNDGHA